MGATAAWAVFTPATGYDAAVAADSPDSYWKLDESSGMAVADSIGTNSGTYNGTVTKGVATGHAGAPLGITLNGTTSSYVSFGDVLDRTGDFTYEALVKLNTNTDYETFLSKGAFSSVNGFLWGVKPDGHQFFFMNWDGTTLGSSTSALSTGVWYHVAITHAANVYTFYLNGAADGSFTSSTHSGDTTGNLDIGREVVNGTAYYPCDCSISSVADYSTALTGTRITAHEDAVDTADPPGSGGTSASGLSADDEHRLDLMWWGVWAFVGLQLVQMIVPLWLGAWGWERKVGGNG